MNSKKNQLCLAAVLTGLLASTALANPGRISDFSLLDQTGAFHQLSYYGDQAAVVIMAQANGDVNARKQVSTLRKMQASWEDKAVRVFLLNSQTGATRASIAAEAAMLNTSKGNTNPTNALLILQDETQLVAETLGLSRVGEVLVINPKTMAGVYQGSLDVEGQQPVADAVAALVSGNASEPTAVATIDVSVGAPIEFSSRDRHKAQTPSYAQDIVPILQNHCVSCHHDGGIGPWAMSSHAMVKGWSAMMREVVLTRRMPPGQIDTHVGMPIADVAGLSTEQMQTLVHWIDAGAPLDVAVEDKAKASQADPLAAMTFKNARYTLGEPDMILQVPAQTIPATGIVDYRYVPVELNLDRDVWVQALEFVPGDKQVLHHVITYLSSPADRSVKGRVTGTARGDSVGGFAPGRKPDSFRDNSGRLIPKGSNLLLQMHYTTSGKETVDATEIGLYLHDKPPAYIMAGGVAGQRRFMVPPQVKEHKLRGEQEIERDAYLYSMAPHMHYRGKYMSYTAIFPDGREQLVLSVPKYDFNWQFSYELQEPLFLPAGSKLVANGAMDNSDRNPGNPDPSKPVHFGLQTKHEMFFGFTTLRYVGDTPQSPTLETEQETAQSATGR